MMATASHLVTNVSLPMGLSTSESSTTSRPLHPQGPRRSASTSHKTDIAS